MKLLLTFIALSFFCFSSYGQDSRDKQEQLDAMKKLEFLTGTWQGKGWVMMGPENKSEFSQKETVSLKTEGTTLLIEGRGKDIKTNEINHDAMAIVYFDPQEKKYIFNSHVMQGYHGTYEAEVKQDTFIWKIENPYAGTMVYTITLNEKGQWFEIGERKTKSGDMVQFFEMTLNRK